MFQEYYNTSLDAVLFNTSKDLSVTSDAMQTSIIHKRAFLTQSTIFSLGENAFV